MPRASWQWKDHDGVRRVVWRGRSRPYVNDRWHSFPVRVSRGFSSFDRWLDVANSDWRYCRRHGTVSLRIVCSQAR
jgi:hypothetical protein